MIAVRDFLVYKENLIKQTECDARVVTKRQRIVFLIRFTGIFVRPLRFIESSLCHLKSTEGPSS